MRVCLIICIGLITGCSRPSSAPIADESQTTPNATTQSNPSKRQVDQDRLTGKGKASSANTLNEAKSAYASKRFAKALQLARAYLVTDATNSEALFLAAESMFELGQTSEGFETLSLIPVGDSKFGLESSGRVGEWHLGSGRPESATKVFERIVESHGDLPLALSRLALLANVQGKRYEASSYLKKLARMQDITRRELGALITISEACSLSIVPGTTGTDDDPVEGDLRRARQMQMRKQWNECHQLTETLRKKFPRSIAIAAYAGTLYADQQKLDRLRQWHADLPDGIQTQPEYWTAMAGWMELEGETDAAIRCCCESLRRDPTNSLLYERFARLLRFAGRDRESDAAAQRYQWLSKVLEAYNRTFEDDVAATDYAQISEYLLKLRRPWEAVGWRKVAGRADPTSVADLDPKIKAYYADPPPPDPNWLICGMDPSVYSLPDTEAIAATDTRPSQPQDDGPVRLSDIATDVGLHFQYDNGNDSTDGSYYVHEMLGGGVGVIDFDRDGFPDLYFSQGGGDAFAQNGQPNELHRNLSGRQWRQVTNESLADDRSYGQGVAVADYNQDGFPDILIANIGPNVVLRNNGDGTFARVPVPAWSEKDSWTSLVATGDLNGDGLPELVECNYIDDPTAVARRCVVAQSCGPGDYVSASDRVLTTTERGDFVRWSAGSALESTPDFSLGAIIANFDDRAGNDLFIANDTGLNAFWVSSETSLESLNGDRPDVDEPVVDEPIVESQNVEGQDVYRLSEEARIRGCASGSRGLQLACMGIAAGDFDQNGLIDLIVTNFYNQPVNFYMQRSAGLFIDKAGAYKLRDPTMPLVGFGTQASDFDRDGKLDIAVLNGHAIDRRHKDEPLEMEPQFFRGGTHEMRLETMEGEFWHQRALGRALALLDWNGDGRPDLIAGRSDAPAALLQNDTRARGNWIRLDLVGTVSERDAVGAKVTAIAGDQTYHAWITGGDGYHCTNESTIDIGLGQQSTLERLLVRWPSGLTQEFDLSVNDHWLLVEGKDQPYKLTKGR